MGADLDRNLIGLMSLTKISRLKKEEECTIIQNSLIEEDERKEQIRYGMKKFLSQVDFIIPY